jgi:molybdopterin-guanine dinucleotide biosynthesis protein A
MNKPSKITGVILAGGLARRMDNQDKGLVKYQGQPLITYAINAMRPLVDQLLINANRNIESYQQFGLPVVSDLTDNFDGPLAGILSAMQAIDSELLMVMPCDCPLITAEHLQKILLTRAEHAADIAVAFDGERLHSVLLLLKTDLQPSLAAYLARDQRKVETWLNQHKVVKVDFSITPEILVNLNTMTELSELEEKQLN